MPTCLRAIFFIEFICVTSSKCICKNSEQKTQKLLNKKKKKIRALKKIQTYKHNPLENNKRNQSLSVVPFELHGIRCVLANIYIFTLLFICENRFLNFFFKLHAKCKRAHYIQIKKEIFFHYVKINLITPIRSSKSSTHTFKKNVICQKSIQAIH